MIVTIDEVKHHLRLDGDEDNTLLLALIASAEAYLINATGKTFDNGNNLAKLVCLMLIADWYEHREATEPSDKIRFVVRSMLLQLSLSGDAT